jgi:hypothetical protein
MDPTGETTGVAGQARVPQDRCAVSMLAIGASRRVTAISSIFKSLLLMPVGMGAKGSGPVRRSRSSPWALPFVDLPVPSGLAPDPERRHRSALASHAVVRRRRAYRGGRRLSGHRSPVAGPRARAPCAGWPVGRSRALRRGPGRSGRRWGGSENPALDGGALLPPGDLVRYTINNPNLGFPA